MKQRQPVFIVGTGRNGSTLLSDIISKNNHILSLSEFFVSLHSDAFQERVLGGEEFWKVISTPNRIVTLMSTHGLNVSEILRPTETSTDPIKLITLPHITEDVELIVNEMKEFVSKLDRASISNQYLRLFDWMCHRFNKELWVERSGMSLQYIHILLDWYPNAKFIHLFRDGRECAMSMSKHHAFRLMLLQTMVLEKINIDSYVEAVPEDRLDELGELADLIPQRFKIDVYNRYDIPLERFGTMWSSLIMNGVRNLNKIPKHNLLNIQYEEILRNPEKEIFRLMKFIDDTFDDPATVKQMSQMVKTEKKETWVNLDEDVKARLNNECAVGLRLLRLPI